MPGEIDPKDSFLKQFTLLLVSGPKQGKSTTALSISAKCPTKLPAPEPVLLDDIYAVTFEEGAFDAATALGLRLGKNLYDMSDLRHAVMKFDQGNDKLKAYTQIMKDMTNTVAERMKTKSAFVLDGLSTFDSMLESIADKTHSEKGKWSFIKQQLTGILEFCQFLRKPVVITAHVRPEANYMGNKNDSDAIALHEATKAARKIGEGDLRVALTGSGAMDWVRQTNFVWPVVKNGSGKNTVVSVLTEGGDGFQGGCRYPVLNPTEPAHLTTILNKIRGFVK